METHKEPDHSEAVEKNDEPVKKSRRVTLTPQELSMIECWYEAWAESDDMMLPGDCSYRMAIQLGTKILSK